MAIEQRKHSEDAQTGTEWFLSRFLMTTIAVIVVLIMLTQVPQVHHVLFQLHGTVDGRNWPYALLWFALMAAIMFLGINLTELIVDPDVEKAATEPRHQKWRSLPRVWTAVILIMTVAFVITLTADVSDSTQSFGFAPWLPLPLPILLIALAALLAPFHAFCPTFLRSQEHPKRSILARLVFFSLLLLAIGEFIWWLAGAELSRFVSYHAYTVWAVYQLLFLLIMLARAIDALSMQGWRWIRAAAVVVAGLYAFTWGPTDVGRVQPDTRSASEIESAITTEWFDALNTKIESIPKNGPVVFVAASGGGSRAALFTALTLESLERVKFFGTTIADRIVLISSVSGGSLASAYFAARFVESDQADEGVVYKWRHTIASDFEERIAFATGLLVSAAREDARSEDLTEHERHAYQMAADRLMEIASKDDPESLEFLKSEFVDVMNMDFMAPLLRACVYPGLSRGNSLSAFWEKHFAWKDDNNRVGIHHDPNRGQIPPVLLLNATRVEDGNRLTIGIPALPPHLLDREDCRAVSLSSLNARYEVSLAEAVRLSANFPWGIPVARLRTSDDSIHSLDGGIADNTGIDMLYEIIVSIQHFAAVDPDSELTAQEEELRKEAKNLWTKLQRRGLVILEIDSGAKPSQLGKVAKLFPEVVNPIQALKKSSYARLVADKEDYLERIDRHLEPKPVPQLADKSGHDGLAPRLPPLTYMCLDRGEVMTAWALGATDKARVIARFVVEDEVNRHKLTGHGHSYEDLYTLGKSDLKTLSLDLAVDSFDLAFEDEGAVGKRRPSPNWMMQRTRHEDSKRQAQVERRARAAWYGRRKK